jgi:hypothetical protein
MSKSARCLRQLLSISARRLAKPGGLSAGQQGGSDAPLPYARQTLRPETI